MYNGGFWVKYKKHISILIVLIIILSLISLIFYKWKFDEIANDRKQIFNTTLNDVEIFELKNNDVIEQEIEIDKKTVSSISFMFATYGQTNNGNMNVIIKDDHNDVYLEQDISLNNLSDNNLYTFELDKPMENFEKIYIKLSIKYDSDKDKIAIHIGQPKKNINVTTIVNGKNMLNKTISVSGYYGTYFSLKIAYFLITIFIILGVILIYYLIFIKNSKLENIFLVSILFIGILYMSIFTPYSIPDEPAHIDTSYRYSNVLMFKEYSVDDGKMLIDKSDYEALKNGNFSAGLDKKTYSYINDNIFDLSRDRETISVEGADVVSPFWMYLPQAMGITIARILGLGSIPMLYLGKLLNLLVFSFLSYVAIKRSPICKVGFAVIALFPMTMQLVSSFSPDAIVIGVSFLLISECLYLMQKNTYINKFDLLRMSLYSILLTPCKSIAYFPICFLCFVIPKKLFQDRKKQIVFYSSVIGSGAISFAVISLSKLLMVANKNGVAQEYYSLGFIFEKPIDFMNIVLNTLNKELDNYLMGIVGKSLSWFNVNINFWIVIVFLILFFVACIKNEDEKLVLSSLNKCWISIICLGVFVAVSIGMFIGWTKEGYNVIEGVQGRYLLPIVILIGILLRNNSIEMKKCVANKIVFIACMLQPFVFMSIFSNNF